MAGYKTRPGFSEGNALNIRKEKLYNNYNTNLKEGEYFNGVGTDAYGGFSGRKTVNSYIGQYNKYYYKATGKSRFEGNQMTDRMFNQLMVMDRNTLQQIQPFIGGRFIFVPGLMPRMMEILHPEETIYMRTMFQSAVTGISGWSERRLDFGTVTAMTEQNSYRVATKQTGKTETLTFNFMTMFAGLPIYRYITIWMNYIYNLGSSAATYPYFTGLEFNEGNHSMSGIYIVPGPDFQTVEEAALIYAMVPENNGAENVLNQTWGEHNVTNNYSISFKVHTITSGHPAVLRLAVGVLADYVAQVELHDYWVNPGNVPDGNINYMGLGTDILNNEGRSATLNFMEAEHAEIPR